MNETVKEWMRTLLNNAMEEAGESLENVHDWDDKEEIENLEEYIMVLNGVLEKLEKGDLDPKKGK